MQLDRFVRGAFSRRGRGHDARRLRCEPWSPRERVRAASPGDTLSIHGACVGSLDIAKDITLAGTGQAVLDAQGQAIRVITIRQGANVAIDGLTIRGGNGFAGVGIHNLGNLTLTNSTVRGNVASLWGGGIYNRYEGTLRIEDSSVVGNRAGENAGGIYNDGVLTLVRIYIAGNDGGRAGGGLLNSSFGRVTVESGAVYANTADYGGGIANNGLLDVANANIAANHATSGGGMFLDGGRALVERSTIADNSATGDGGGINHGGGRYSYWMPPALTNVTIAGNRAGGSGGGLANTGYIGAITLVHATIADNRAVVSGAGLSNTGYSGEVTLRSTIVASPAQGENCIGPVLDGGYNLDGGTSCSFGASSLSGTPALLDPVGLASNGGWTQTIGLKPASPAVDAIPRSSNGCGTTVTADQRGVARPQGSACDIGAFELEPDTIPPTLVLPGDMLVDADGPNGRVVTYAVSATDDRDASPTVTCSPASGGLFPIGDTVVSCTATDATGNSSTGTFTVHVKASAEQVDDLLTLVDSFGLGKLGTSLHDKLVTVQRFLAAGKNQQAEENLAAFVSQVDSQRGKGLTQGQADALKAAALRIIDVIPG